jgi:hypothetical protein
MQKVYYQKGNGFFESDYFYQTQMNPLKKLIGRFFDSLFTRIYWKKVTGKQKQPAQISDQT